MLKILIADDHAVVRSGLRQFLAEATDCRITGEARSGHETLALIEAEHWDLLLLDIGLPDANGIDLLKRIKQLKPLLPVLIFSMNAEDEYALSAFEAGAAGYLQKDSLPGEILQAIRRCCNGEHYLSPSLTTKLLTGNVIPAIRQLHDDLSRREFTIMQHLSRGRALTAIAESLYLSPKTVSTYRARLLEKLKLQNNSELTRYVIKHKLDPSP